MFSLQVYANDIFVIFIILSNVMLGLYWIFDIDADFSILLQVTFCTTYYSSFIQAKLIPLYRCFQKRHPLNGYVFSRSKVLPVEMFLSVCGELVLTDVDRNIYGALRIVPIYHNPY